MTDDDIRALREALAGGPTPGPWTPMPAGAGEQCVARINNTETVPPKGVELAHESVDARYIAAASPDRIARLLDEVERLRAALTKANNQAEHFEREWYLRGDEIERLRSGRNELEAAISNALPGVRYMDPPDGGSPSLAEQLLRMAEDAERYLWLRGDSCMDHSARWTQWEVRRWDAPIWTNDLRRADLDAAIDDAMRKEDTDAR